MSTVRMGRATRPGGLNYHKILKWVKDGWIVLSYPWLFSSVTLRCLRILLTMCMQSGEMESADVLVITFQNIPRPRRCTSCPLGRTGSLLCPLELLSLPASPLELCSKPSNIDVTEPQF